MTRPASLVSIDKSSNGSTSKAVFSRAQPVLVGGKWWWPQVTLPRGNVVFHAIATPSHFLKEGVCVSQVSGLYLYGEMYSLSPKALLYILEVMGMNEFPPITICLRLGVPESDGIPGWTISLWTILGQEKNKNDTTIIFTQIQKSILNYKLWLSSSKERAFPFLSFYILYIFIRTFTLRLWEIVQLTASHAESRITQKYHQQKKQQYQKLLDMSYLIRL